MNWVAITRTVTLPSAATLVPRFCSANSPESQCFWIDALDIAGRVDAHGQSREHDCAQDRRDQHADPERPEQLGPENAPLVHFRLPVGHGSADRAAREEYKEIDQQIAEHQQCDRGPGEHARTPRHLPHHRGERRLIDSSATSNGAPAAEGWSECIAGFCGIVTAGASRYRRARPKSDPRRAGTAASSDESP
jgi:hypothetical protein